MDVHRPVAPDNVGRAGVCAAHQHELAGLAEHVLICGRQLGGCAWARGKLGPQPQSVVVVVEPDNDAGVGGSCGRLFPALRKFQNAPWQHWGIEHFAGIQARLIDEGNIKQTCLNYRR